MDSKQIITFSNPMIGELRGFLDEKTQEPWFFAGKVCDCLKIKNSNDALKGIEERHLKYGDKIKGVGISYTFIKTLKGTQKVNIISERILYELIFRSNTQKAFEFQNWVWGEVLPALRKHGEYRMEGKLIRRSFTDTVKDSKENERMHGHAYSNYTVLINKSLGLGNKVDRNTLSDEMLEKIAKKEDLVRCMIADGKQYGEIKAFLLES